MPRQRSDEFPGHRASILNSLANEPILILAALVTVYIDLGVLAKVIIHPITILSTLPSAGVGAILALLLCHTEFSVIALIGLILLIGIVKKNAIMMIDLRWKPAQRTQSAARRNLRSLFAAFPTNHDDHHGGTSRRITARSWRRRRDPIAPSARYHHRRRINHEPDSYALHNAGNLSRV